MPKENYIELILLMNVIFKLIEASGSISLNDISHFIKTNLSGDYPTALLLRLLNLLRRIDMIRLDYSMGKYKVKN